MHVWLVTVGEPLPIDGDGERLLRAGIIAQTLLTRGDRVTWWSSTLNHTRKTLRATTDCAHELQPGYTLRLLHSVAYRNNISLARLANHYGIARKFATLSAREPAPDVILCSFPTIELSVAAVRYGHERRLPVVLDVRDLWPDIFVEHAPRWARPAARTALMPLFHATREAFSGATAITGVTRRFRDWGLRYAERDPTPLDREFFMAYPDRAVPADQLRNAECFWDERGVGTRPDDFIACFFGTFGRQFELDTVIAAARQLANEGITFVLCGDGDHFKRYAWLAEGADNIVLPGWVGAAEIRVLMQRAAAGLAPYINVANFSDNLPNKPIEYLSAGLPIVSSLQGELAVLLEHHRCGVTYANRDTEALASALLQLKRDTALRKTLAANAYNLYRERFVADNVYGAMADYLEKISLSHTPARQTRHSLTIFSGSS